MSLVRCAIRNLKLYMPKKIMHSYYYRRQHGKKLNFKEVLTYDEKIHWHMVHTYDDSYGKYADKLAVRNYVEECGLKELLIPLISVYENVEEIDFDELPTKFIMVTNHASGSEHYYICTDKAELNIENIKQKFEKALNVNYAKNLCEYQYAKIKPKILCEQLLSDGKQERLNDYKVVCHYGVPEAILVCTDREKGRDYYSTEWKYLEYTKTEFRAKEKMKKPEKLEEMLNAASILSKPFPIARIDFYIVNDKLYFGEITLSPAAGGHCNLTEKGQLELGRKIPIK